ncbi:hypothetical protein [Gallaecimonas pentaromativorans]|uniref:hypothetical protein n=1 Tax=Gallaecimonas pentaromativorans TaxID=584787 RepID=UPI003A8D2A1C
MVVAAAFATGQHLAVIKVDNTAKIKGKGPYLAALHHLPFNRTASAGVMVVKVLGIYPLALIQYPADIGKVRRRALVMVEI